MNANQEDHNDFAMTDDDESNTHGHDDTTMDDSQEIQAEIDAQDAEMAADDALRLSAEERQWAIDIKEAARQNAELKPLSDFEYAKNALVFKGDVQTAVNSMLLGQEFRECYHVDNSVEQGVHCLEAWMTQQPGFVLHLDVNDSHEAVKVVDPGVLNPKAALGNAGRNWKDFITGLYYFHTTAQPSFPAIRQGFSVLLDFGDVDSSNFSLEVQYQFFAELCRWYPFNIHSFMAFHTGMGATTRLSLVKAVMPRRIRDKMQLGCEINENDESRDPMERLRHFYLQPDLRGAQEHLLARARVLLEYRADNELSFRL